jgi:SAM-dependent methyltransferase
MAFRNVPCDFCGSEEYKTLFSGRDLLLGLPGLFTMVECSSCGLIRQNPQPTPDIIQFFYPSYYPSFTIAVDDEISMIRKLERKYGLIKMIKIVEKFQKGGKLLDVGCSTGNFLSELAKRRIWDVEGVDPSQYAVSYAQKRFGLKVRCGFIEEIDLPTETYDVVTMWDVLEHTYHPYFVIKKVNNLLKNGGYFIFSVPNMHSLDRYIFGKYWMGWDLPRHLYLFPDKVLDNMLRSAGFEIRKRYYNKGNYISIYDSTRFFISDKFPGLSFVHLFLGSIIVKSVMYPLLWIIGKMGLSWRVVVIAQKISKKAVF